MQSTSISVNKQTVKQFLEYGAQEPFVFPEYQRPYSWGLDQTDQLFEDLWTFSQTEGGTERNGTYFLGCFVFYSTKRGLDIVDGQQRMTTLTLLLRALYTSLDAAKPTKEINYKKTQIGPTIWKKNKADGEIDFSKPLISSKAVDDRFNDIFHSILRTGTVEGDTNNNYARNYLELQRLIREKSQDGLGMPMIDFCEAVLNQCIVLPIQTDTQETAQIIFNTLNARGLALSDADIFKAMIFGHITDDEEKQRFINQWKKLSDEAEDIGMTIQNLLGYYMFYLRARNGDTKTTTIALRTFYQMDDYKELYNPELLDRLNEILLFLRLVVRRDAIENEDWSKDRSILCALDILRYYPNDYWRYPVLIYYLRYKGRESFIKDFYIFLRQLSGELMKRFCVYPTLTAVKGHVLALNNDIFNNPHPVIDFGIKDDDIKLEIGIKQPSRAIRYMLLSILAYTRQDELLPRSWEIEHIFPQSWKDDYAARAGMEAHKEYLDYIGNYLPLEKKLNVKASDQYFEKKKASYKESEITIVRNMGESQMSKFEDKEIIERGLTVAKAIINITSEWRKEYDSNI